MNGQIDVDVVVVPDEVVELASGAEETVEVVNNVLGSWDGNRVVLIAELKEAGVV